MRTRLLSFVLIGLLLCLAACSGTPTSEPPAQPSDAAPTSPAAAQNNTEAPPASPDASAEATPEAAPSIWDLVYKSGDDVQQRAEYVRQVAAKADYSYDDMSKSYAFDILGSGVQADPFPANDPVKQWYKEKLNIDLTFTCYINTDELEQQITLRYASNSPPDYALLSKRETAVKLHKQGLIIDDWQPYLSKIPSFVAQGKDTNIQSVMSQGKMYGIPLYATSEGNIWQTWIRKDWLDKLGIAMPKTPEDLLTIAKRFTEEDPDGNGQADTWGFSSCGEGKQFGWIDGNINAIFELPTVGYVDNTLYTRDINPHLKDALAFVKTLVDNQWIDPDWYTQDWLKCYNKIRAGQVGIVNMWMPGAMTVLEGGAGEGALKEPNKKANGELWKFEDWALVQTDGYKTSNTWDVPTGCWVAPASLLKDEGKFLRLLHLIDFNTCPNEGGVNMGLANEPAGGKFIEVGIGKRADWSAIEPASMNNYRLFANFNYPLTIAVEKILPWFAGDEPEFQQKVLDMLAVCNELPAYEEYLPYVTLPTELVTIQSDLTKYRDQAQIDFVLGKRSLDEWDAYVQEYLGKMQGQKILDAYAAQLQELKK